MFVGNQNVPRGVHKVETVAADLRAAATVRAPAQSGLSGLAVAAVAHAQGTMHKCLDGSEPFYRIGYGARFIKREFARHHELAEAGAREKKGLFRRADVALGACMQGNRRNVEPQKRHVLHYQCVGSRAVQLFYQTFNSAEFRIIYKSVERYVDLGIEAVGIVGHARYVGHRICGSLARAVAFGADINGIGAMFYCLDGCRSVAGRGKQLYSVWCHDFCFYAKVHKKEAGCTGSGFFMKESRALLLFHNYGIDFVEVLLQFGLEDGGLTRIDHPQVGITVFTVYKRDE